MKSKVIPRKCFIELFHKLQVRVFLTEIDPITTTTILSYRYIIKGE